MDAIAPPPPAIPRPKWKIAWAAYRPLVAWCAIAIVIGASLVAGLAFRRATWEITKPIRFGDIQNGFRWAMESSGPQGYLNQYEKMADEKSEWGIWLDYAPLRLFVMDRWGTWIRKNYPQPIDPDQHMRWQTPYAFNRPVLDFNTAMDAIGAICAFFLTRLWVIRAKIGRGKKPAAAITQFTGVIPGLVAALTLWFNPAMLLSAYGWPTWDAWIVPMYLLAALLASLDWWFAAGVVIAVGAMFKGQQLTVAPVFLLWALMLGQLGAAARWCAGLIAGMAVIASPWLFTYLPPEVIEQIRWTWFYGRGAPQFAGIPRIIDYPAIYWVLGIIAATVLGPLLAERIKISSRTYLPLPRAQRVLLVLLVIANSSNSVLSWFAPQLRTHRWFRFGVLPALLAAQLAILIAYTVLAIKHWKKSKSIATPAESTAPRVPPGPRLQLFWKILGAEAIFAAAVWPWFLPRNRHGIWLGLILSAALALAAVGLRRRARPFVTAAAGGIACLLCIVVFHGSHAWWDCGFHFGTIHWQTMIMGHTDNLPGLLEIRYKWPEDATEHAATLSPLFEHLPFFSKRHLWPAAPLDLSIKMLFDTIYTILLIISGIGLGLQARRRDPRFLVALITPWVLFFTIPVQIHERYLLFAAGAAAVCIGQSVGTWLLGLFLSFITLVMTLHVMLLNAADIGDFGVKLSIAFPWLFSPDSGPTIFKYIDGSFPDAAWSVILAAGIFLYFSFAPTRRERVG